MAICRGLPSRTSSLENCNFLDVAPTKETAGEWGISPGQSRRPFSKFPRVDACLAPRESSGTVVRTSKPP